MKSHIYCVSIIHVKCYEKIFLLRKNLFHINESGTGTCSNPTKVSFSLKVEVMRMSKKSTSAKKIKIKKVRLTSKKYGKQEILKTGREKNANFRFSKSNFTKENFRKLKMFEYFHRFFTFSTPLMSFWSDSIPE